MKSIRRHLTIWLLAGMGVLVVACSVGCYLVVEETLTRQFDQALMDKVAGLGGLLELELEGVEWQFSDEVMPEFSRPERPEYFELWRDDGTVFARSGSLGRRDLPRRAGSPEDPRTWELTLPDGRRGRAAGTRFTIEAGYRLEAAPGLEYVLPQLNQDLPREAHFTVVCARETRELTDALTAVFWGLVGAGSILCLGICLLVGFVVRSGCRPLGELSRRIANLEPERLSDADFSLECPDELEPLRRGFAHFARRITASIEREKRITSNIAHELRTPVAELKMVTEMARTWPDDEEIQSKSRDDAHEIAVQMDRLVRACLRMARLQSVEGSMERRSVDLSSLLTALCSQNLELARGRNLGLDQDVPPGATSWSDPEILELVLGNLLDNAVHYAPEGSWVRVTVTRRDGNVTVTLTNPVPEDFDEQDLASMSEPFWRKEEARSDCEHLGLGLAMATSAAQAIGASLGFALREGCFEATLALPTTAPGDPDSAEARHPPAGGLQGSRDPDRSPRPAIGGRGPLPLSS